MQPERAVEAIGFEVVTVGRDGRVVDRRAGRAERLTQGIGRDLAIELIALPGGDFAMGSPPGQGYDDERPRHRVAVGPFLLGRYPVTQEQWTALMGENPSRFKGARLPVENVSWERGREFCRRLTRQTGRPYRLPTEAEWEYACRAGTTTPFAYGETLTTDLANYCGEHTYADGPPGPYRHTTTEVGSFPPNAFGLCDMHGSVWEWCADAWHAGYLGAHGDGRAREPGAEPSLGVLRGGSWHDPPELCRSAARLRFRRHEGDEFAGLRVAADPT
jgi:formylglycine-generating enzyme required for sulfatase activity